MSYLIVPLCVLSFTMLYTLVDKMLCPIVLGARIGVQN